MVKIAFVFPGQGSQFVGMGKDFYEHVPAARQLFEEANEVLGYDLTSICFNGPDETLKLTENTQPAIFLVGFSISCLLIPDLPIPPGTEMRSVKVPSE